MWCPTHIIWVPGGQNWGRGTVQDMGGAWGGVPRGGKVCRGRASGGRRPRGPTGVRPQVAGEGVPPAARIVAEMTLEGLFPRVQLDVPEQVALLREGGPALVALEGPLAWEEERGTDEINTLRAHRHRCRAREEVVSHGGPGDFQPLQV